MLLFQNSVAPYICKYSRKKMNNNTTKFAGNVELFKIYD